MFQRASNIPQYRFRTSVRILPFQSYAIFFAGISLDILEHMQEEAIICAAIVGRTLAGIDGKRIFFLPRHFAQWTIGRYKCTDTQ